MDFSRLMAIVGDEPVFETGLLLAGDVDPAQVWRQLSRWVKAGRIYQLRRGVYALAPPFQKVKPHPFLAANRMVRPSYVSLQSALAFYGLIADMVPTTTGITAARACRRPRGRCARPDLTGFRNLSGLSDLNRSRPAPARPSRSIP